MDENKETLKKEIFEEFKKIIAVNNDNPIKEKENNNKKLSKQISEIKQYLLEKFDKNEEPKENEKSKEIEKDKEEKAKELKLVKKGVNEIKTFLLNFEEKFKNFNDSLLQLSKVNDEKNSNINFDNLKSEIENKMSQSFIQINNQFKNLNSQIVQISNLIKSQELKKEEIYVKEEKEKILSCHFNDGNYTLQSDYNSLIKMNEFKIELELLNNGTLNWPSNCFLKGNSNNNELNCNFPVNQQEIYPEQSIKVKLVLFFDKIQNDNYEIDLPIKLINMNNVNIKQNGFKFKLIVKESKAEKNNFDKSPNVNYNKKRSNNPPIQTETDRGDGNDYNNNNKRNKNDNYYSQGYFNDQHFGKKNKDDENKNENLNEGHENNNNQNRQNFIVEDDNDDEEENNDKNKKENIGDSKIPKSKKSSDLISDEIFQQIKLKLEEDYTFSNTGMSDKDLKEKILNYLDDDIIKLLDEDVNTAIEKICEFCGEEIIAS